jgi:hypothetical protein
MTRLILALLVGAGSLFAQANTLTAQEKAEGWVLLFDGKTLNGWDQGSRTTWRAENGALVADTGEPVNLRGTTAYSDFIVKFDFRHGKDGNSGFFIRSALQGQPATTGYEVQIWNDHEKYPTGSLVNHLIAKPAKPAPDEWHSFEVTAQGDHFIVVLDGEKILDDHDSKSKEGYFYLQFNKGKKIEFRNIKVKKL